MAPFLKKMRPFTVAFGLFLLAGSSLVLVTDKGSLHLWFNQWVGGQGDLFFRYYTHVGDGLVAVLIILAISLLKPSYPTKIAYAALGISSFLLSGLLAQFLKRVVFSDWVRPIGYFASGQLQLVEGVQLHSAYSFPSGHSTTSFALFFFLAFAFSAHRGWQVACLSMAALAAYSRVYLSQHFLEDTIAGAALGGGVLMGSYATLRRFPFFQRHLR